MVSLTEMARERGPIAEGGYRVLVIESRGNVTHRDFAELERAVQYANDAASEDGDRGPIAYVLDSGFAIVKRGIHYAT